MNQFFNFLTGRQADPNQAAYEEWLRRRGGGGIPTRQDYIVVNPSHRRTPPSFDQAGYDKAMEQYDWRKRVQNAQQGRFLASMANVMAPRYPKQPRAGAYGPAQRQFVRYFA